MTAKGAQIGWEGIQRDAEGMQFLRLRVSGGLERCVPYFNDKLLILNLAKIEIYTRNRKYHLISIIYNI
jgi:hypothetical protein